MEKQQGFSLLEVLISLVLLTTVFCTLAKALWQAQSFINSVLNDNKQLQITLNQAERRLGGFGLAELLISLALSSFIMAIFATQYVQMKASVEDANRILTKTFDMLRIDSQIRESLHQAGYTPCMTIDKLVTWDSLQNADNIAPITLKTPSHLIIKRLFGHYETFESIVGDRRLVLPKAININKSHPIIIADCQHAEIHRVDKVLKKGETTEVWLTKPLKFIYPHTVYWGRWLEAHYFIKATSEGKLALYYKELHSERLTDEIAGFESKLQTIRGHLGVFIKFIDNHQQQFWQLNAFMSA